MAAQRSIFGERHACSHGEGKGAIALDSFYMWNPGGVGQDSILFLSECNKYSTSSLWLSWES